MIECQELFKLDYYVSRKVAEVYIMNGRDAAIAWLRGYWYATGVNDYERTQKIARVFGLEVSDLS